MSVCTLGSRADLPVGACASNFWGSRGKEWQREHLVWGKGGVCFPLPSSEVAGMHRYYVDKESATTTRKDRPRPRPCHVEREQIVSVGLT